MDMPDEAVDAALTALDQSWVEDASREQWGEILKAILGAAAPHMLAEAFAYGWREGAGIAAPVDLDTGEPMHDQAAQPAYNPYRSQA